MGNDMYIFVSCSEQNGPFISYWNERIKYVNIQSNET